MADSTDDSKFLMRLGKVVHAGSQRVEDAGSALVTRLRRGLATTVAPGVERAARAAVLKLAEPENARRLQDTLAGVAQFAMRSGFRADPNARLLFDFVDELEQAHGRPAVLEVVVAHAVTYEADLMAMLVEAVQEGRPAGVDGVDFAGMRDRAGTKLLTLLCSLASLEADEAPPLSQAAPDKVAYFEAAPIDERFKPLARMACGDKSALRRSQPRQDDSVDKPGLLRRALARFGGDGGEDGGGEDEPPKTRALARLMPSLADPAMRFLTTSYLFFVQSYLLRAMIEELPEMLGAIAEIDRRAQADDPQVVDVGD